MNAFVGGLVPLLLAAQTPLAPGGGDPGSTPPPSPPGWQARALAPTGLVGDDEGHHVSMNVARYRCGPPVRPCTRIDIVHQRQGEDPGLYRAFSHDGGESFHQWSVATGLVGAYASIASDFRGRPVASYHNPADNHLWIARPGDGEGCGGDTYGWHCERVGYPGGTLSSITSDRAGHVYAVYHRTTSPSGFHIWHDNPDAAIGRPMAAGSAADIAVDEIDRVHLAWISGPCLYYRYWSPSAWSERETVECAPEGVPANAGRVSIKVDRSWHPHVAYTLPLPDGGHRVRHAYKTDAYIWVRQAVASAPVLYAGRPSLQPGISIVLDRDNDDTAAISYGITTSDGSRLVVAFPRLPVFGWRLEVADLRGGAYSSMAWLEDRLAVAHQDAAWKRVRFARRDE